MEINDYKDPNTNACISFKPLNGQHLIAETDEYKTYEYYKKCKCFKGNPFAGYCDYCPKEECLYYNPDVKLVPSGQAQTVILNPEEAAIYAKFGHM